MPLKCPSCGEMNRDDALMCSLCQERFTKVRSKHPPAITGHAAWPQIERALDGARGAAAAEQWDEARRLIEDALGKLAPAQAVMLVVSVARQWSGGLRLDPTGRSRINACMDRFRWAVEQSRFSDAGAEIKAANELARDQGGDDLPLVVFGIQALANRSDMPAPAPRPQPKPEPAAALKPSQPESPAAASFTPDVEAARAILGAMREFNGLTFDASLGSLIAIDGVLDELWGSAHEARSIDPAQAESLVEPLALCVGDVAVRQFGAQWMPDTEREWALRLPGGTVVDSRQFVRRRISVGWSHDLWLQLETSEDLPALEESVWTAIGDYGTACGARGRPRIAARLFAYMTLAPWPRVQAQGYYLLSMCARMERRFDDRIVALDRALAIQPDTPAWIENKAAALLEANRVDEAAPLLERALVLGATKNNVYHSLANVYRDMERLEDAATWYQRAVGVDAAYTPAWVNLTQTLTRLGRHEEAIDACDHAVRHGGAQSDQIWLDRAQSELAIGRGEEAMQSLSHLPTENADAAALRARIERDVTYLLKKARTHDAGGRMAEAIAGYWRVLEVDPLHAEAHLQLALALEKSGDLEAALEQFDTLVMTHPDLLAAEDHRAALLVHMKRFDDARQALDEIVAKEPSAGYHRRRGDCLATLGRPADALADYVRAVDLDPSPEHWVLRASMERELGNLEEAKQSCRHALAVRPGLGADARAQVHRQLWEIDHPGQKVEWAAAEPFKQEAFKLAGLQRHAEALEQINRALELDPVDAKSWQTKGASLVSLGRRDEAVEALRRAVEYDAPLKAGRSLAHLLVGGGRWDEALAVLDHLMAIDAKNPEYRHMRTLCLSQMERAGA